MGTTIGATAGVAEREQGLASGLLNTAQQLGFAVGIAALVTVSTSVSEDSGAAGPGAAVDGYQAGLLVGGAVAALGVAVALLTYARVRRRRPTHGV
jgi:hypothetical protein